MIRSFFTNHNAWSIDITICYSRNYRWISNSNIIYSNDFAFRINYSHWIVFLSHSHCSTRVISAFNILFNIIIYFIIWIYLGTWTDFFIYKFQYTWLIYNFSSKSDAVSKIIPIFFATHIVKNNFRVHFWISVFNFNPSTWIWSHRSYMKLKSMPLKWRWTIIIHRNW